MSQTQYVSVCLLSILDVEVELSLLMKGGAGRKGWKDGAREEYAGWMRSKSMRDLNGNVLMKPNTYSASIPILRIWSFSTWGNYFLPLCSLGPCMSLSLFTIV